MKNRWEFNNQPDHGRIVTVSDSVMHYWTPLQDGEQWEAVARSFTDGYDHDGVDAAVECYAALIVGGDEIESAEFSFNQTGEVENFKRVL